MESVADDLLLAELGLDKAALRILTDSVVAAHVAANAITPVADAVLSLGAHPTALIAAETTAKLADIRVVNILSGFYGSSNDRSIRDGDVTVEFAVRASNTVASGACSLLDALLHKLFLHFLGDLGRSLSHCSSLCCQ